MFEGSKAEGIVGAGREIDLLRGHARLFDNHQLSWDQVLGARLVAVDVEPLFDVEVQRDLGKLLSRNGLLLWA